MRFLLPLLILLATVACSAATPAPTPTEVVFPTDEPTSVMPKLPTLEAISLRVIPPTLRRGLRVTMIGMGFADKEQVEFYFTRPDGTETGSETSTSDLNGNAAYSFDIPSDWEPGDWMAHVVSKIDPTRRSDLKLTLVR